MNVTTWLWILSVINFGMFIGMIVLGNQVDRLEEEVFKLKHKP